MEEIGRAQNFEVNLRRQLAARRVYLRGKRIYFGGASFAVLLALASPVVVFLQPDWAAALGAIAGAWLFTSRLVLEPWRERLQLEGATAQEMFDCAVLGLDWNRSLARRLSEEQVNRLSGTPLKVDQVINWYPSVGVTAWPASVLTCQRANAVWARRQHQAFGNVLVWFAVAWAIFGIIMAVGIGSSLATYLVAIAMPSLPALLDALDMSRGHWRAADARQLLEDTIDSHMTEGGAPRNALREIQDQLFVLRREAPLVPEWYYKIIKPGFETDMRYAASLVTGSQDDGPAKRGDARQ